MKLHFGSKRRYVMTSRGIALDTYGRYVFNDLYYARLYGVQFGRVFVGVFVKGRSEMALNK